MVLRYSFKIENTEVGFADGAGPNYVLPGSKITHTRENANGNSAVLVVSGDITTTITPAAGNEIIISRGETTSADYRIFKGDIKKVTQNEDNTWTLTCTDPLQRLKHKIFSESYDRNIDPEAGELSAIAEDIITNGGLTASAIASGTGGGDITVDKFKSDRQSRLNRLNLIQKLLNWVLYFDYDNDYVRLEPKGYTEYPTTLTVGDQIKNIPNWEEDIENMRNVITVTGATQLDTRVDTFSGTGSETEFELTYEPVSVETKIAGVLQVLGIPGANATYDYEVDVDRKLLTFETAPVSGTNNIECTYTTYLPTPVTGKSSDSIAQYGLEQDEDYDFPDVVTIDDAEVRVQQLLDILQFGEISTYLNTDEYNIRVGNKITTADPLQPARDGEYIVQSKVINYGSDYDVLKIGTPKVDLNQIFSTIDERLKNLEGGDKALAAILRKLIALVRTTVTLSRISLKLERRNISNSWTPGHDTLAYLRASQSDEADCSTNGNHAVWNGTGVSAGDQYETINYNENTFEETSISSSTTLKINRRAAGTYYERTASDEFDVTEEDGSDVRLVNLVTTLTQYYGPSGSFIMPDTASYIIGGNYGANPDHLVVTRKDTGVVSVYDSGGNAIDSTWTYVVPAGFREAMDYDITSDTGIFVGSGDSNGTILTVSDLSTGSATENYYSQTSITSPTGVTFDGTVTTVVLVDGTNKVFGTLTPASGDSSLEAPVQRLGCGLLNGTDRYLQIAADSSLQITGNITLISFVKLNVLPSVAGKDYFIIDARSGINGYEMYIKEDDDTLRCNLKGLSDEYPSGTGTALEIDTTYMLAVTYDGSNIKTSINAVNDITDDATGTINVNTGDVFIGSNGGSTNFSNMKIDETMIFNEALTDSDLQDILENKFGKLHSKFANCKLWLSYDDPLIGDRRTDYVEIFENIY